VIRVNLIGQDRRAKRAALSFLDPKHRVPLGTALIIFATIGGIGWWYWTLAQESATLAGRIAAAEQQAAQLKPVLAEVQAFEQRRAQLRQRVELIEELRGGQSVPVQLLDAVSKSVPDLLWLTQLDQQKNEMTIEGRSSTLIALSDFVGNLGGSGLLQKPIEIVSSQVESVQPSNGQGAPTDVIKFTVRAQLAQAAEPTSDSGATPAAGAPTPGGTR
jgi:type IV pilus assembly protein PilN